MVITIVPLIALGGLGGAFIWAVARDMRQGEAPRRALASRLDALPLRRLLEQLDVDPVAYLHGERFTDIERHLRTCAACPGVDQCTPVLGHNPDAVAHRCPNYAILARRHHHRLPRTPER